MRVIAGTHRGRMLSGPKGPGLRPTADRVREAIFNILGQWVDGLRVLDLFAGTGALALEALSRGAGRAVLVDCGREAVRLCRQNARSLGLEDRLEIVAARVEERLLCELRDRGPFELVFVDPPYGLLEPVTVLSWLCTPGLVAGDGQVVYEHDRRESLPDQEGDLRAVEHRRFGDTTVSFYRKRAQKA